MTCIAAMLDPTTGKVWMAGDSCSTRGTAREEMSESKIWKDSWNGEDILFGVSGSGRYAQVMRYTAPLPKEPFNQSTDSFTGYCIKHWIPVLRKACQDSGATTTKDGQEKTNSMVLVARQGRLYVIDGVFTFSELTYPIYGIGSGGEIATGYLWALHQHEGKIEIQPRKQLRLAVKAASRFASGVGGRIDILSA